MSEIELKISAQITGQIWNITFMQSKKSNNSTYILSPQIKK